MGEIIGAGFIDFSKTEIDIKQCKSYLRAKEFVEQSYFGKTRIFTIRDKDLLLMEWLAPFVVMYCKDKYGIDFLYRVTQNEIIFFSETISMDNTITVRIPYGRRSDYIDVVWEINNMVEDDGLVSLFVNNNPYSFDALLVVETKNEIGPIRNLINKTKLEVVKNKGFNELLLEMTYRKWNKVSLNYSASKARIALTFEKMFVFPEISELEAKNYFIDKEICRKKVFISYCHAEKDIVYQITEILENKGIDLWIDKKDLQSGTPLLRSILQGIDESDVTVSFVSKSMKKSLYAQAELDSIMTAMVNKASKWSFVKLDDVNISEIFPNLQTYVYIDYYKEKNVDKIVDDIFKKLYANE